MRSSVTLFLIFLVLHLIISGCQQDDSDNNGWWTGKPVYGPCTTPWDPYSYSPEYQQQRCFGDSLARCSPNYEWTEFENCAETTGFTCGMWYFTESSDPEPQCLRCAVGSRKCSADQKTLHICSSGQWSMTRQCHDDCFQKHSADEGEWTGNCIINGSHAECNCFEQ